MFKPAHPVVYTSVSQHVGRNSKEGHGDTGTVVTLIESYILFYVSLFLLHFISFFYIKLDYYFFFSTIFMWFWFWHWYICFIGFLIFWFIFKNFLYILINFCLLFEDLLVILTHTSKRLREATVHIFFFKKGALKNFRRFLRKHLCWSLE